MGPNLQATVNQRMRAGNIPSPTALASAMPMDTSNAAEEMQRDCPTMDVLKAMATACGCPLSELVAAAKADGCSYP